MQPVGVGGDAHHPLAHVALEHREVAAVAAAVGGDLLVGDDRAQARAPVDRRVGHVRQAVRRRSTSARSVGDSSRHVAPVAGVAGAGVELGAQLADRPGAARAAVGRSALGVVPRVEDLQEDPLRPAVVAGSVVSIERRRSWLSPRRRSWRR